MLSAAAVLSSEASASASPALELFSLAFELDWVEDWAEFSAALDSCVTVLPASGVGVSWADSPEEQAATKKSGARAKVLYVS